MYRIVLGGTTDCAPR